MANTSESGRFSSDWKHPVQQPSSVPGPGIGQLTSVAGHDFRAVRQRQEPDEETTWPPLGSATAPFSNMRLDTNGDIFEVPHITFTSPMGTVENLPDIRSEGTK